MDDSRLRVILIELERWEGRIPYLYLDAASPPNATVGVGCLVRDAAAAAALPWRVAPLGRPATHDEAVADFERVRRMLGGRPAHYYQAHGSDPVLYLDDADVTALGVARLRDTFLPGLRKLCPRFDAFPEPAQACLIDMAWNLGMAGLGEFRRMLAACNDGHWGTAALECHVSTSRYARNAWRAGRFLAAGDAESACSEAHPGDG